MSEEEKEPITEFEQLKRLLLSKSWPFAASPVLICNPDSEEDKLERAHGILNLLIKESLHKKKFLDFGCGEGHITYAAASFEPRRVVGYDIKKNSHWSKIPEILFTNNLKVVERHAPYDVILLMDVLDHAKNALQILHSCRQVLSATGKLYIRTHPFCSRHGGHQYYQINKAYIHLIFKEEELENLGCKIISTKKVMYPMKTYFNLIDAANLSISEHFIHRIPMEKFFTQNEIIKKRIQAKYSGEFPKFQCEQQFIDIVAVRKPVVPYA